MVVHPTVAVPHPPMAVVVAMVVVATVATLTVLPAATV